MLENLKEYRFEFKHITVLFAVLMIFQLALTIVQENSLKNFLDQTHEVFQKDSAERMANLTATSLELLLENVDVSNIKDEYDEERIIQSFNVILSQQLLQKDVEDLCLLLFDGDSLLVLDDGRELYSYLSNSLPEVIGGVERHSGAIKFYRTIEADIVRDQHVHSILENGETFHIFVPFVPNGEFFGVFYLRKHPNLAGLTNEIISSYDVASLIYSSLIILGLLTMYYISSFTVRERDEVRKKYFEEKEDHLKEQINHEKEMIFTKRIYHTHHKAEKVMGFIKEDLKKITSAGSEEITQRVNKYSNFMSRVIYDMKWYDVPVQTIHNEFFNSNINEILEFLVNNIFLRMASATESFTFSTEFDERLPRVKIDEFIVWELLEPLIQNSIDHAGVEKIEILIKTEFNPETNISTISISDNGSGIPSALMKEDENGLKLIFAENISTKHLETRNSGYGCFIAYQMAVKKCGWELDVSNNTGGGCTFTIRIKN